MVDFFGPEDYAAVRDLPRVTAVTANRQEQRVEAPPPDLRAYTGPRVAQPSRDLPRTSWTAADLLQAEFPPPRWAVPGLVAEGANLLCGSPKLGKSWAALNICTAVAVGGRALGKVAVDQGEALYLSLEDTPRRLQTRLRMILEGEPAPPGLHFATEWQRMSDGGGERLDKWLQQHPDCRLVVVDVLARVRSVPDGRGQLYDADYAALASLKAIADTHSTAVLVVHHTRKSTADDFMDMVSGTNGLNGAADATLVMRRARNSGDATLQITGRDVEESEHAMRFDRGRWTLLDGPASDYSLAENRRRILEVLRETPMRPKQIAAALNLDYELVKKTVQRMVNDDQLDTDGAGLYFPPVTLSPPSLLSLDRDTGDSRDTYLGDDAA